MTEPYLGEIQLFAFNYNPYLWAFCNGATMSIAQNTALFALLGVQYGGNGSTTFQLPNFAGRAGCSNGQGPGLSPHFIGEAFGTATVTLAATQIPSHTHALNAFAQSDASRRSGTPTAGGAVSLPSSNTVKAFAAGAPTTQLSPSMLQPGGNGQPHANVQPYLGLNFSIALAGIFPPFN